MDIRRAKEYVEEGEELVLDRTSGEWVKVPGLVLTEEAWLLIYGDDIFDVLEVENAIEQTEALIERLENLGDGSAASAELVGRIDRHARKYRLTRETVRKALLDRERQKLAGVHSPHAPESAKGSDAIAT